MKKNKKQSEIKNVKNHAVCLGGIPSISLLLFGSILLQLFGSQLGFDFKLMAFIHAAIVLFSIALFTEITVLKGWVRG